MFPSRLKLTMIVISIGLARASGGGFQQPMSRTTMSLMVSSCWASAVAVNARSNSTAANQCLDALGVLGGDIGSELDHDAALGGLDHDRIGLVEIGGQRLRDRGGGANQRGDDGENSDHENSGSGERRFIWARREGAR